MSAKKEEAPPAAAKDAAAPAGGDAAAAPAAKGMNPMIPLILTIVLAPVLSLAVGKFVLLPSLTKQLAAAPAAEGEHGAEPAAEGHGEAAPAEEKGGHGGGHGKKGEAAAGAGNTYEFENIVVNLAGTMGTRYLKVTFMVTGKDKGIRAAFESNKPKMIDVTINVLSSLSLSDLEEAGAKNIIREKLIAAYNQAIDKRIVEQLYFADFVVQ